MFQKIKSNDTMTQMGSNSPLRRKYRSTRRVDDH